MSSLKKKFNLNWMFEAPEAVLTCSTLKCGDTCYLVFGGHDKTLYLMNEELNILDSISFDGWVRTTYPIDLTGDGCQEVLVGAGDGNFLVVKFVKGINKLAGIMNFKTKGKVLCVTAGDFTRDGNNELIYGGEDKTLKIFENIDSKEPNFILYYDSWVTACTLGYLKLPDIKNPIYGLLVGTKNGLLQLIQSKEGKPDVIWQKDLGSQINTVAIGDVTNDGYYEIVIASDDSYIKILNSEGESLKEIKLEEGRPISLKIVDIDDDNANEIIVGSADGSLRVYHNTKMNSTDIELKWKTSTSTSVKVVSTMTDPKGGLTNIIFGGYDRSLRCVTDFECGEKPALDIPYNIVLPETKPELEETPPEKTIKLEIIPTNIREYIFKDLIDKKIIQEIALDLEKRGYLKDRVIEEFERMITEKQDQFEKITYSIWTLPKDKIGLGGTVGTPVKKRKKIKPIVIEQETEMAKGGALIDALTKENEKEIIATKRTPQGTITEENLRTIIIHHLEKNKIVPSKTKLVDDIVILGYNKDLVEKQIEILKDEGVVAYSRADPKGWYLAN
ncbi:MAG: WD40 repeat domain-containing protein, partial [Candidatus Odinarchaeota archaeon]